MENKKDKQLVRVHILISGFVQGVCFRAEAKYNAQKFNIKGWIKNRPDGKVEILLEGKKENVDKIIDWCRIGPSGAVVSDVSIEWQKYLGEFEDFSVR